MKFAFKNIVAAAAFVAAGAASAAVITVPTDGTTVTQGVTVSGAGTLSFSELLLGALDTGKIVITPYGTATPNIVFDEEGYYASAGVSAPLTSLKLDSVTGQILSAQTTGGATQTAKKLKSVSTAGGFLTVTDINVDMTTKNVYATIIGANGVGQLNNFHLWNAAAITGATVFTGPGEYTTAISGLSITTEGFNVFSQALSLTGIGLVALQGVQNYGTITSVITATPAIPEPSTYALMGVGLVSMGLMARRRRAQ